MSADTCHDTCSGVLVQEHVDPAGRGGAAAAGLDPGQGEVPVGQPRVAAHQWRPDQDREMLSLLSQHDEISTLHNTAQCPLTYHRLINSNSSAGLVSADGAGVAAGRGEGRDELSLRPAHRAVVLPHLGSHII